MSAVRTVQPAAAPGPFEREAMRIFAKPRIVPVAPDLDDAEGTSAFDERSDAAARPGKRRSRRLGRSRSDRVQPGPMTIAAGLTFARTLDGIQGLVADLRTGAPCVLIDVLDPLTLAGLRSVWALLLYGPDAVVEQVTQSLDPGSARRASVLAMTVTTAPKPKDLGDGDRDVLRAVQCARPILCLSPDAATCLPPSLSRAADHRLALPPLDRSIVATTIRLVTGRRCRAADFAAIPDEGDLRVADLAIAIRADRTPADCAARLARLAALGRAGLASAAISRSVSCTDSRPRSRGHARR